MAEAGNSTPAAPAPVPAQGVAAAGQPKVPDARTNAQARIDELAAQKAHWQQKFKAAEGALNDTRERLARLEGRVDATPAAPHGKVGSWTDMDDRQLDEAIGWSQENQSKEALAQAINEKIRRATERASKQSVQDSQKQFEQATYLRDVHTKIVTDFGPDAFDETSALYQAADRHMAAYVQRYGKDAVRDDPDKLYDAFLRAERQIRTPSERERLSKLEQENAALTQRASLLERGGAIGLAPKPSDEVMERLKAHDTKGAIRALGLTRSMTADARRRMVAPRS